VPDDPSPARPGDADAIAALVERAYGPYQESLGVRPLPMDDDYDARVASGQAWVVRDGDGLAGALVLVRKDDHLLLDNVAVDPSHQGKGLGEMLLDLAEVQARAAGYSEIRLYTNERMTRNIARYQRRGYVEFARETIDGRHAVWLRKRLADA
jgi:ribosomal protein S18 acetylase RimI-like enzyme